MPNRAVNRMSSSKLRLLPIAGYFQRLMAALAIAKVGYASSGANGGRCPVSKSV